MAVRNLHKQGKPVIQLHIIDQIRKFFAEFLCQKDDPDLLIGQDLIKLLLKLLLFVHNRTFNPGQTHAGPGVDIVTDQIHFHKL